MASTAASRRTTAAPDRSLLLIVALALAGCAIAAYLTLAHYTPLPLACSTSGVIDCARVTSSAYSVVPGTSLPITLPGLLWFAVSGALALAGLRRVFGGPGTFPLAVGQLIWGLAGLMAVLYLVYVEIVVLGRLCLWCSAAHLLIVATLLVALRRLQILSLGEIDAGDTGDQEGVG